jgi:hypothetical protein
MQNKVRRASLRLRAWWIILTQPGQHPIAELIAYGRWADLDLILALMEKDTP